MFDGKLITAAIDALFQKLLEDNNTNPQAIVMSLRGAIAISVNQGATELLNTELLHKLLEKLANNPNTSRHEKNIVLQGFALLSPIGGLSNALCSTMHALWQGLLEEKLHPYALLCTCLAAASLIIHAKRNHFSDSVTQNIIQHLTILLQKFNQGAAVSYFKSAVANHYDFARDVSQLLSSSYQVIKEASTDDLSPLKQEVTILITKNLPRLALCYASNPVLVQLVSNLALLASQMPIEHLSHTQAWKPYFVSFIQQVTKRILTRTQREELLIALANALPSHGHSSSFPLWQSTEIKAALKELLAAFANDTLPVSIDLEKAIDDFEQAIDDLQRFISPETSSAETEKLAANVQTPMPEQPMPEQMEIVKEPPEDMTSTRQTLFYQPELEQKPVTETLMLRNTEPDQYYDVRNKEKIKDLETKLRITYTPNKKDESPIIIAPLAVLPNAWGAFAAQNFTPRNGKKISLGRYMGKRIKHDDTLNSAYIFEFSDPEIDEVVDAEKERNFIGFFNHSEIANCDVREGVFRGKPEIFCDLKEKLSRGNNSLSITALTILRI